jgi:uncharacterized membrane protein
VSLRVARAIALVGYFGLMALLLVWHGWLHPSRYFPTALVLGVTVLPLLLPLHGLLHGRPRAYLGASLLMLLYFMHGVVETAANPLQRLPAALEVLLSLIVLVSAAWCARQSQSAFQTGQ